MNKQIIALAIGGVAAAQLACAAPDPLEIHERVVNHLKAVRDHFVPAPIIDFVESFPPIAIPREKVLLLAQNEPRPVQAAGGVVQVGGPEPFQVAVPPSEVGPDGLPIDPSGIANWAQGVALSTTQHALDGLFPRTSGPRRPVIVGGDSKNAATLEEDLTVMLRILEKAAGAKADGPATASGIQLLSFGQPNAPRAFYLDGYGAMFVLNVRYPLVAPQKPEEKERTSQTNSEWEKARDEVYGRRNGPDDFKLNAAPGEEFDAQRVERLKSQLISDFVNAKNIRNLKPDDSVTVAVLGGGSRGVMVRREIHAPQAGGSGFGGGGGRAGSFGMVATSPPGADGGAQSTMTLRVKKSDIDAFAKEKLTGEEFRKKVSAQVY